MSEVNYDRSDDGQLIDYFRKNHPNTTRYQLKETNFRLWDEFRKRKLMLVIPLKIKHKLDERVLALRPRVISEPEKQEDELLEDKLPEKLEPAPLKIMTYKLPLEPSQQKYRCHDHYIAYTVSPLNGISKKQLAEIDPELYRLMVDDGTISAVPTRPYNGDPVQFSIDNYGRLGSSNELKHVNYGLWKELFDKGLLYKVIRPISKKMAVR